MTSAPTRPPSLAERLSKHFEWRLRHTIAADLIASSIENGLLQAIPFDFQGKPCVRLRVSASALGESDDELLRRIRDFEQIGLGLGQRHRFILQDGDIVVDESFLPTRLKRSGSREITFQDAAPLDIEGLLSARAEEGTDHVLKLIWRKAARPLAGDLAALLLLAEGVGDSDLSLVEIIRRIAKLRSISTIFCDVDGFEERIVQLLTRGLILPGESVISQAGQVSTRAEVRLAAKRGARRNVIVVMGSLYHPDDYDKSLAAAAKGNLPILALSEFKTGIPKQLNASADIQIACPSLSAALVGRIIETVSGERATPSLDGIDFRYIGLDDLDLAIGQGNSAAEAVERLTAIARDRVPAAASARTPERAPTPKSGGAVLGPASSEVLAAIEVNGISGYPKSLYEWTDDLKRDLKLWRSGELAWDNVGSTLLLSGPPGTGKTAFARSLAKTLGASLLQASVSSWLQASYLGSVLKVMRTSFSDAAAQLPTILFVDEIDGIGSRSGRTREYSDYWNSVVNQLLELLNPAVRAEGVIIVGATNRPSDIDHALLRAGRLKPHIEIGLPDAEALAGIFRRHLSSDLSSVVNSAPPDFHQPHLSESPS